MSNPENIFKPIATELVNQWIEASRREEQLVINWRNKFNSELTQPEMSQTNKRLRRRIKIKT